MPQRRSSIVLRYPMLGKVEGLGFTQQPPVTTPDSLNTVPFDVIKQKGRGGQRAGLKRYFESASPGTGQIQSMRQATRVLPSLAVIPDDQLLAEPFTGPNGTKIETTFPSLYDERWSQEQLLGDFPNVILDGSPTPLRFEFASSGTMGRVDWAAVPAANLARNSGHTLLVKRQGGTFSFDVNDAYVLKAKITTTDGFNAGAAINTQYFLGFMIRGGITDDNGFYVGWEKIRGTATQRISIISEGGTLEFSAPLAGLPDNLQHRLEARVNKDFIEVYWDDVRIVLYVFTVADGRRDAGRHQSSPASWTDTCTSRSP